MAADPNNPFLNNTRHGSKPVLGGYNNFRRPKVVQDAIDKANEFNAGLEIQRARENDGHPLHRFISLESGGKTNVEVLAHAMAEQEAAKITPQPPEPDFQSWLMNLGDETARFFLGDERFAEFKAGTIDFSAVKYIAGESNGELSMSLPSPEFTAQLVEAAQKAAAAALPPKDQAPSTDVPSWPQTAATPPKQEIPTPSEAAALDQSLPARVEPIRELPPGHPDYVEPAPSGTTLDEVIADMKAATETPADAAEVIASADLSLEPPKAETVPDPVLIPDPPKPRTETPSQEIPDIPPPPAKKTGKKENRETKGRISR